MSTGVVQLFSEKFERKCRRLIPWAIGAVFPDSATHSIGATHISRFAILVKDVDPLIGNLCQLIQCTLRAV